LWFEDDEDPCSFAFPPSAVALLKLGRGAPLRVSDHSPPQPLTPGARALLLLSLPPGASLLRRTGIVIVTSLAALGGCRADAFG